MISSTQFYKDMARYYDDLFPLNSQQSQFVLDMNHGASFDSMLDLGCGSGNFLLDMLSYCSLAYGWEPDSAMLALAQEKMPFSVGRVILEQRGMEELNKLVRSFSLVTILGNTLVHLNCAEAVLNCLKRVYAALDDKGLFVFQIIHYDRVFEKGIFSLPTLETERCVFERYYGKRDDNLLDFQTKLTLKREGRVIEHSIPLYPLRKHELENMLKDAGFLDVEFYGGFNAVELTMDSIPLVGVARKY
jgi:SAM-dependent methyltransferase